MKTSPVMQEVMQQLMELYNVDLTPIGTFPRLDQLAHDNLFIDHIGTSQIATYIDTTFTK